MKIRCAKKQREFCVHLLMGLGQDQQQHPVVHTGGELAGGGSLTVAVDVSYM